MEPSAEQRPADPAEFECTVVETRSREPGFYETATRIFYVTREGAVYLLRAPGAVVVLQPVDDLPEGCAAVSRSAMDEPRRQLAAFLDRFGAAAGRA